MSFAKEPSKALVKKRTGKTLKEIIDASREGVSAPSEGSKKV